MVVALGNFGNVMRTAKLAFAGIEAYHQHYRGGSAGVRAGKLAVRSIEAPAIEAFQPAQTFAPVGDPMIPCAAKRGHGWLLVATPATVTAAHS